MMTNWFVKASGLTGWVLLILSIWFVGGCLLVALGLIGEYIGNIFMDVKLRPRYNMTEVKIRKKLCN